MEDIGSILPRAFKKQIGSRKPGVLDLLAALWPRIVGKLIARHSRPTAFTDGLLTVSVSSPPWATQLSAMAGEIQSEINSFLESAVVRKVSVRYQPDSVPDSVAAAPPAHASEAELPVCSQDEVSRVLWAKDEMKLDPEIVSIVERSFVKYFSRARRVSV